MATGGDPDSNCYEEECAAVGGKMPTMCNPCRRSKKTTPASLICSTCDTYLCRECCQIHQVYVPGEHKFSSIQDDGHVFIDMHGLDLCEEHDRGFVYVCKDHDALVCDECLFYRHRRCDDIHKLTEIIHTNDAGVDGPITPLQDKLFLASAMIENCQMQLQSIEGRRDQVARQLHHKKMEFVKRFDEAKARIEEELDELNASDISRLKGVKRNVETMQTNLQELVALHEIVGKKGTAAEKFIINFAFKKRDPQVTGKLDELKKNIYTTCFKLIWNEQIQHFFNSDDLIAHLQETLSTLDDDLSASDNESVIDLNFEECNLTDTQTTEESLNSANSSLDLPPPEEDEDVPRPVTLTLETWLDLVQSENDNDFPFVVGLDFLEDGRIAAVDVRNGACFIMDADLQRQGYGFMFHDIPKGVACFQNNKLAVTLTYVH